jgi:hypothetical protein
MLFTYLKLLIRLCKLIESVLRKVETESLKIFKRNSRLERLNLQLLSCKITVDG